MTDLLSEIRSRRSYYNLTNQTTVPDTVLEQMLQEVLRYTPSAFNMQSARLVLLLGQKHVALWEETAQILKDMTVETAFEKTRKKIDSFKNAYGTVLFYEDDSVISSYADSYPLYRDNFTVWSEQASGMLQSNVWMALESKGLGANLQHYNPLIDTFAGRLSGVPESWRLIAQMPFGVPKSEPAEKTFLPLSERFKTIR